MYLPPGELPLPPKTGRALDPFPFFICPPVVSRATKFFPPSTVQRESPPFPRSQTGCHPTGLFFPKMVTPRVCRIYPVLRTDRFSFGDSWRGNLRERIRDIQNPLISSFFVRTPSEHILEWEIFSIFFPISPENLPPEKVFPSNFVSDDHFTSSSIHSRNFSNSFNSPSTLKCPG